MSQAKLPYYPGKLTELYVTPTGLMEISDPMIYEQPLQNGKIIARVDSLEALRPIMGNEIFLCRKLLYELISGSTTRNPRELFAGFYRKYKKLTKFVNDEYTFGDDTVDIYTRCINQLMDMVHTFHDAAYNKMRARSGKYLIDTHGYTYYAFTCKEYIPDIEGLKLIC